MQRKENESFAHYVLRRAASNKAVRMINIMSKSGGKVGTRESLRSNRAAGRQRGIGITRAASTRRSPGAAYRAWH